MNIKEYMKKVNVTKKSTVIKWLNNNLIPGVRFDNITKEWYFPASARRPYNPRHKPNTSATVIRASIVNACIKRQYISNDIYNMSIGEFNSFINQLIQARLIMQRIEDNIVYYDSTFKADEFYGKSFYNIKKFVIKCLGEVAKQTSCGMIKGICESSLAA